MTLSEFINFASQVRLRVPPCACAQADVPSLQCPRLCPRALRTSSVTCVWVRSQVDLFPSLLAREPLEDIVADTCEVPLLQLPRLAPHTECCTCRGGSSARVIRN